MDDLKIAESAGAVKFGVKVVPAGSRTELTGVYNGMLKVKVSAVAEKGKANQHLVKFLAERLGVKKADINIVSGQTNPVKQLQVEGFSSQSLLKKLNIHK